MRLQPTLERVDEQLVLPDLSEWIELYLNDCRQKLYKPTTITHYSNALKRFGIWYDTRVVDGIIRKQNAKDFGYWLSFEKAKYDDHPGRPTEDEPLSPATVRRSVGVVRSFMTWLSEERYLTRNLKEWFPLTPVGDLPQRIIETVTLEALFRGAATGEQPFRDTSMIALLADTGLRRAEIAMLKVGQVCFLDEQGTGYLKNVLGKFDKLRDVPFSPVIGKLVENWIYHRGRLPHVDAERGTLFIQDCGKPISPRGVYEILRRSAKRSGVQNKTWNTHSIRHNFATNHWRIQRDTKSLAMVLGHSSQKVTEDIYVHPVPADLIESHTSVMATGEVDFERPKGMRKRLPPTKFLLSLAIEKQPNWCELGRQFRMSDVGVRKLAIRYELLEHYYASRKKMKTAAA